MDGHFSGLIKPFEAIGWCQVQGRVDGSCHTSSLLVRSAFCFLVSLWFRPHFPPCHLIKRVGLHCAFELMLSVKWDISHWPDVI